jgi:hypothetical protein
VRHGCRTSVNCEPAAPLYSVIDNAVADGCKKSQTIRCLLLCVIIVRFDANNQFGICNLPRRSRIRLGRTNPYTPSSPLKKWNFVPSWDGSCTAIPNFAAFSGWQCNCHPTSDFFNGLAD